MKKIILLILCIIICTSCQKQGLDANAFIEPVEFPMMERVIIGDLVVQVVDTAIEDDQIRIRFALTATGMEVYNIKDIAKFKVVQGDTEIVQTITYEFFNHYEGTVWGGEIFYANVTIDHIKNSPFTVLLNDEPIDFQFVKAKGQYFAMDDAFDLHHMHLNPLYLIFDHGSIREDRVVIPMVITETSLTGKVEDSIDIYFQDEDGTRFEPEINKTPFYVAVVGAVTFTAREEVDLGEEKLDEEKLGEEKLGEGEPLIGEYKLTFSMKDIKKGVLIVKDKSSEQEVKILYERKEMSDDTIFFFEPPYEDGIVLNTLTVNE